MSANQNNANQTKVYGKPNNVFRNVTTVYGNQYNIDGDQTIVHGDQYNIRGDQINFDGLNQNSSSSGSSQTSASAESSDEVDMGDQGGKRSQGDSRYTATSAATYSLKLKHLKFGDCIGEGAHGKVYDVTFTQGSYKGFEEAVVKIVSQNPYASNEVETIRQLDHRNIVKLLHIIGPVVETTPPQVSRYYIVMERGQMSLWDYIGKSDLPLSIELKYDWALSISNAVEYLHGRGIVHRDIKPQNCIIFICGEERTLKLCDFGIARKAIATMPTVGHGSYIYIAPETDEDNPMNSERKLKFSRASDIYQIGCVLWELFARDSLAARKTVQPYRELPDMRDEHKDIEPLLRTCFQTDPHDREDIHYVIDCLRSIHGE